MIRKSLSVLGAAIAAACFFSCNGQGQAARNAEQAIADTLQGNVYELPLPEVPSVLAAPEERAEYIISRFWDGMDFADTLRSRDRLFMEQNFVNFLSLFPHAKQEALPPHIGKLLKRAAADSVAFDLVNDIAERYLDDPNSPMRCEEYYILFLEELLRLPRLSEYDRIRPAYRLETAKKNRPGTVATDFSYTDRNGNRQTLHSTQGKQFLLLFYDPACSHCSEILNDLHERPILDKLVSAKELTVLAVYTEGDRKLWDETKEAMPQEWIVSIDDSNIVERELYALPAMPVIYLLDAGKRVILKDVSVEQIEAWLSENSILQKNMNAFDNGSNRCSDYYITVQKATDTCGVSYTGLEQHLLFYHKNLVINNTLQASMQMNECSILM